MSLYYVNYYHSLRFINIFIRIFFSTDDKTDDENKSQDEVESDDEDSDDGSSEANAIYPIQTRKEIVEYWFNNGKRRSLKSVINRYKKLEGHTEKFLYVWKHRIENSNIPPSYIKNAHLYFLFLIP